MRRVISIIVFLLVAGYFVNSCIQNEKKEAAARFEVEAEEREAEDVVLGLESTTGATRAWVEGLRSERHIRRDPVLTVELERLWLTSDPILFLGELIDVVSKTDSQYLVTVKRSRLLNRPRFATELQVTLSAPKGVIDDFMKQHGEFSNGSGQRKGVAVAARIYGLRSSSLLDSEDKPVDVRIGEGELLGIVYTGDVRL